MPRASSDDPSNCQVVISGYACRLPGAPNAAAFWALLEAGQSAIIDIPPSRWDADRFYHPGRGMPGKMHVKSAGLIDGVWDFDPGFFGISPREATEMDPQQRLMLEVVWESIEHAKLIHTELAGPRTGVFVGASACDNSISAMEAPSLIGANFMTGNTMSILSNRISHQLDLRGSSYTIDTACSSSLYALHQAVGALRRDEIDTAIVTAVNLILSPFPFIGFSRAAMLSPDGQCKAFDASANGYVRGEGCVAFVLRRGDRMVPAEPKRSEVLATGIASAGKTVGISMPSEAAQAALLSDVYLENSIDPSALAFVEAHGTGTPVGDPIEASALGRILGARRAEPLKIGSAKTNIGHLEACSGLVGLLKAQLALEHRVLPKSLHCHVPNPRIDFEALNLCVQQEASPLVAAPVPALAGINSFGFGGANAHAVLRHVPQNVQATVEPESAPLLLTAASRSSLNLLAQDWKNRLKGLPCGEANALVAEAAHGRTRLAYRAILAPEDGALVDQLQSLADDVPLPYIQIGHASEREGLTAFVFCGNGAQWAGMGATLYRSDPIFARGFDRASDAYLSVSGLCLSELLLTDYSDNLDDGLTAQPLLFALQVGLVYALDEAGLQPDAVAGHSVGEVAAAWSAGCISLHDASRLIYARAMAMRPLRGRGTLAAALADVETAKDAILEMGLSELVVAADNSPRSCTISGPGDQIASFVKGARRRRLAAQKIPVDYPYHGPALEQIASDMRERLGDVSPRAGNIPFISATLGNDVAGTGLTADYWWRNAREPVRFREAVLKLCEIGATTFVEIGPQPLLQSYITDTAKSIGRRVSNIATLNKSAAKTSEIRQLVSNAIAHGARERTGSFFGRRPPFSGDLPSYPWDRAHYRASHTPDQPDLSGRRPGHPLLGAQLRGGDCVWQNEIDALQQPWLADHQVDGVPILPAAAFAEMALAAGVEILDGPVELRDFDLVAPLALQSREDASTTVRTSIEAETGIVRIESMPYPSGGDWRLHARGTICKALPRSRRESTRCGVTPFKKSDPCDLYSALDELGLNYGPSFARVADLDTVGREAHLRLKAPVVDDSFALNPTLLDAALHGMLPLLVAESGSTPVALLPVRVGRLILFAPGSIPVSAAVDLNSSNTESAEVDVKLFAADGACIARVEALRLHQIHPSPAERNALVTWCEHFVPVRYGTDRPVIGPKINETLLELGLVSENAPMPSAGALIVDCAARRIGWNALCAAARSGLEPDRGAARLRSFLMEALALDGLRVDEPLPSQVDAAPYPHLEELLQALIAEEPTRAEDLAALVWLSEHLSSVLCSSDGLTTKLPEFLTPNCLWEPVETTLRELLAKWPERRPMRLLLPGNPPGAMLSWLSTQFQISEITISNPPEIFSTGSGKCHRAKHVDWKDLNALPSFDVIATAGVFSSAPKFRLSEAIALLAPRGMFMATEPMAEFTADLAQHFRVIREGRSSKTVDPSPRSRSREEWEAEIAQTKLCKPKTFHWMSGIASAVVITGEGGSEPASRAVGSPARTFTLIGQEAVPGLGKALKARGHQLRHLQEIPDPSDEGAQSHETFVINALPRLVSTASVVGMMAEYLRDVFRNIAGTAAIWVLIPGQNNRGSDVEMAMARGLCRTLINERPELDLRLVQADASADPATLADLLGHPGAEKEFAVAGDNVSLPRVARSSALLPAELHAPDACTYALTTGRPGRLDSLIWEPSPRSAPNEGEVEIAVAATGLNFRDVMWAQRILPAEALEGGFAGATLGMECAGTIVRCGKASGFSPGERVVAFAPQAFAQHVTVSAGAVAPLPASLNFFAGAALPTIFLTAHYALHELARIRPGEVVLIHGGAGGVGHAALQLAKAAGARVLATAGTQEKRAWLRHAGAEDVFDSRDLNFVEEIREQLGGAGIDIILNSLAGEAMSNSLDLLAPFGRFVELGKLDFYRNTRLALRSMRENISFFAVDVDQLVANKPEIARSMFREVIAGLNDERYVAPPIRVFDGDNAADAFKLMQKSGHLGKVVVTPPRKIDGTARQPVRPFDQGGWLITGGLGGLGLAIAEWLVARGVSRLWLLSRTGRPKRDDADRLATLKQRATVTTIATDVTDEVAMASVFDEIAESDTPLAGILHGAMVLDDGLIATCSAERIDRVLAPKVTGAEILDRLSRPLSPEHFLLLSSISTLLATPGQGAYVAANSGLEAIAVRRRAERLPGLAIGLAPVSDRGVISRNEELRSRIDRQLNSRMLTSTEVFGALDSLLADPNAGPVVTIGDVNWGTLAKDLALVRTPKFEWLDREETPSVANAAVFLDEVLSLEPAKAGKRLTEALTLEAARVLDLPGESLDPYRPLVDLGFDSLMAVDLKLSVEERLGIVLPLMSLSDRVTMADLAVKVLEQLRSEVPTELDGDTVERRLISDHLACPEDHAMLAATDDVRLRAAP